VIKGLEDGNGEGGRWTSLFEPEFMTTT